MAEREYQKSFVLTVAESKRLIARGVAADARVREALEVGIVAVAKGTTNGYIVEELTGEAIAKPDYCTGTTKPKSGGAGVKTTSDLPDLVLRKGERWEGVSATEAVAEFGPGDVFIKGANALNYGLEQAALLVGHPTGGTIGAALGTVVARRATLLIPVGLEKSVPGDLVDAHRRLSATGKNGAGATLWPVDGEIFTEFEALDVLAGVEATLIGAGGISGAEGAVWLSVWGMKAEIDRAEAVIADVQGEPAFGS